ncbi:hypothetical protein [Streptomyces sp. CBG33]|uniref:hypothetical protein n=1 Tax=Streptomyces sp. CBG33 TaxID=2762624 RepID=UPI0037DA061E
MDPDRESALHGPRAGTRTRRLAAYHAERQLPFAPPGHKQGRGADPRVRAVLGEAEAVLRGDLLAMNGLDDRTSSRQVLQRARS